MSLYLNEFVQSETKQKLSSVHKITSITAIADKKVISVFCVSGGTVLTTSACCSNSFFSLALFSPGIHNGRENKVTNNYM